MSTLIGLIMVGFLALAEFSSGWGGEAAYNGRQ